MTVVLAADGALDDVIAQDHADAMAVGEAVARAEPDAVIHQMTSLAGATDLRHFDRMFAVTNQLRTRGIELKNWPILDIIWIFCATLAASLLLSMLVQRIDRNRLVS